MNPTNWNMQFEELIRKASTRIYILLVCRFYDLSAKELDVLIISLIVSIFMFSADVWGVNI